MILIYAVYLAISTLALIFPKVEIIEEIPIVLLALPVICCVGSYLLLGLLFFKEVTQFNRQLSIQDRLLQSQWKWEISYWGDVVLRNIKPENDQAGNSKNPRESVMVFNLNEKENNVRFEGMPWSIVFPEAQISENFIDNFLRKLEKMIQESPYVTSLRPYYRRFIILGIGFLLVIVVFIVAVLTESSLFFFEHILKPVAACFILVIYRFHKELLSSSHVIRQRAIEMALEENKNMRTQGFRWYVPPNFPARLELWNDKQFYGYSEIRESSINILDV